MIEGKRHEKQLSLSGKVAFITGDGVVDHAISCSRATQ